MEIKEIIKHLESRKRKFRKKLKEITGGNSKGKYNLIINELEIIKEMVKELKGGKK
jgi:hypothetical protein